MKNTVRSALVLPEKFEVELKIVLMLWSMNTLSGGSNWVLSEVNCSSAI
jgi:hypothetical protein